MDILERVSRAAEEIIILAEKQTAVLAFFHRNNAGAEGLDLFAGFDQAGFFGQFACFAVIEDEHVDPLEEVEQGGLGDVDPEVHRVGDDELRFVHLVEHLQLQIGRDIGQEDEVTRFEMVRKLRGEGLEDIEGDRAGFAGVHVPHVFAGPAEGFPRGTLHAFEVDPALLEEVPVVGREVVAHDSHEIDRGKVTGGDGGVGRGAAEKIETFLDGSFDVVERDGTNNENGHGT